MLKYIRLKRKQKNKILDYLEELCETSSISKKTLGNTIRSYHVSLPFVVMILLFYGTQFSVTVSGLCLIFVFIMFFISNGCLLTMLEHRLCGDEFTIADPFIETFGIESTSENRVLVSYGIAIGYFIFFYLVYYYRFLYKSAPNLPSIPNIPNIPNLQNIPNLPIITKIIDNVEVTTL